MPLSFAAAAADYFLEELVGTHRKKPLPGAA